VTFSTVSRESGEEQAEMAQAIRETSSASQACKANRSGRIGRPEAAVVVAACDYMSVVACGCAMVVLNARYERGVAVN